jgi:hypothetical protein
MTEYFTSNIEQAFKAKINDITFIQEDKYYAVKRFLEQFSNVIDEIKSENPDFQFDEIPNSLIDEFSDAIYEAGEYGDSYYDISEAISVERKYETEDITDIYVTYTGVKDTYFEYLNNMLEENAF